MDAFVSLLNHVKAFLNLYYMEVIGREQQVDFDRLIRALSCAVHNE